MNETLQYIETINKVLERYPEITIATVFGSISKNRMTQDSDIDIGIAGDVVFTFDFKNALMIELSSVLSREVDIVDMRAVSGTILKQALSSGQIIKKDSNPTLVFLMKKLWYDQADMMPLVDRIAQSHIRRFIHG
jgi:predicted nucleotidyltransferase